MLKKQDDGDNDNQMNTQIQSDSSDYHTMVSTKRKGLLQKVSMVPKTTTLKQLIAGCGHLLPILECSCTRKKAAGGEGGEGGEEERGGDPQREEDSSQASRAGHLLHLHHSQVPAQGEASSLAQASIRKARHKLPLQGGDVKSHGQEVSGRHELLLQGQLELQLRPHLGKEGEGGGSGWRDTQTGL